MPGASDLTALLRRAVPDAPSGDLPRLLAAVARAHGARPPSEADARDEGAEEDPAVFLWWLLRMAARTARARPPSVDAGLEARLRAALAHRPDADLRHGQLHVDAASTLRRAAAIARRTRGAPGPVLAVGDDDAVSLALALLGVTDLCVVDVDEPLLEFLSRSAAGLGARLDAERVDVLAEPVPTRMRRRCAAAVADPFRSADACLSFCAFGAAALRRDAPAWLFLCDHEDWTFDHDAILPALARFGFTRRERLEDLHAYPLSPRAFPRLDAFAAALELDAAWLAELVSATRAWSHLDVLSRAPDPAR